MTYVVEVSDGKKTWKAWFTDATDCAQKIKELKAQGFTVKLLTKV